jgi:hypothetical protein
MAKLLFYIFSSSEFLKIDGIMIDFELNNKKDFHNPLLKIIIKTTETLYTSGRNNVMS